MAMPAQRGQWEHFAHRSRVSSIGSGSFDSRQSGYGEACRQAGRDMHDIKHDWTEMRTQRKAGTLTFKQWCVKIKVLMKTMVESGVFSVVVACAILLYLFAMLMEVDGGSQQTWFWKSFWKCINNMFMVFFTVELALRMLVHGIHGFFCQAEDRGWNTFDFVVVVSSWFMFLADVLTEHGHAVESERSVGHHQWLRLLRSVRLLRILRVLRIFRLPALKKLDTIVSGLMSAFSTVMWVAVLLFTVMFVSAILCTTFIGHEAHDWDEDDRGDIRDCFGNMWSSFATLFQFLTLADWAEIVRLVSKQHLWMAGFLVIYVCFAALVILSLLTGIVADHVNEVREQQEEDERVEAQEQFNDVLNAEFQAFKQEVQCSGRPRIDRVQFHELLAKKSLRKELKDCDVNLDCLDVDEMFDSFNSYSDGMLSWPDFEKGMQELRKGVEAKEIFKLEVSLQRAVDSCDGKVRTQMLDVNNQAEKEHHLETAKDTARGIHNQLDSLVAHLDDYIARAEGLVSPGSESDASWG